ncbi:uncharacterized protein ASPGLDRAFT_47698 [Aspergillus glaucus CBS 516.65]|uniref:Uncharacterized protein n=1 Tax=Aspergillus glaucus CBS 516.65 TaxID=1160497 RepID=A0A1L9VJD8_ASPGL|nr:hypothetical protein ASPGLDRAFT_47698 [Aspergillus glaucus CBS 516.65]OJJ83985.1 hypothetical protein ASPGLDRAFT_47698 [Aspergillus glaucus CBS 516.65]
MDPISHTNSLNTLKSIKLSLLPSHHIQLTFYNRLMASLSSHISIIMVMVFVRQQRMGMILLRGGNSLQNSLVFDKGHFLEERSDLHSNYVAYFLLIHLLSWIH